MLGTEMTRRRCLRVVMAEELQDTQPLPLQEVMEAEETGTELRHRPTRVLLQVGMGAAVMEDMEDRLLQVSDLFFCIR
jgi:hypothetical protein